MYCVCPLLRPKLCERARFAAGILHLFSSDPACVRAALAEFQGKLSTFPDLFAVDWVIDPNGLKAGDPGAAIRHFQSLYQITTTDPLSTENVPTDGASGLKPDFSTPTNLSRYRDYLRAIWI